MKPGWSFGAYRVAVTTRSDWMTDAPALRMAVIPVALALVLFCVRRLVLLTAALAPRKPSVPVPAEALPTLTVLVPARDEASAAKRLLASLDRVAYPRHRFFVILISDGSTDGTAEEFTRWAIDRPWTSVIVLETPMGKASALNRALARCRTELIAVCDADLELRVDTLSRLAAAFADPVLGATAAMLHPANARQSAVSSYAAVETWVHQLITSAGKDRLDVNPPALGASMYRRIALEQIGYFPSVAAGEDVATTVALIGAGWRTRFTADAIADNRVASTLGQYWHQHIRWFRGSLRTTLKADTRRRTSLARRLEAWMLTASYSDRLVFMATALFAPVDGLARLVAAAYLGIRALEIVAAVAKADAVRHAPRYLLSAAIFFLVDVAASAVAITLLLARRPPRWYNPRRTVAGDS
jgi:cellulose synthase/poly-beta-1,6-N-acetylglucosamine synthase-like glycosyltransferase